MHPTLMTMYADARAQEPPRRRRRRAGTVVRAGTRRFFVFRRPRRTARVGACLTRV